MSCTPITSAVMGVEDILSPLQKVPPKASVIDAARSYARSLWGVSGQVSRTSRKDAMPRNISSNENSKLSSQGPSCIGNSISPTWTGNQAFLSPSNPSIAKRGRNAEPFNPSTNGVLAVNGHFTSYFSGIIGLEVVSAEVADINLRERMNFASRSALGKTPKFVDLGLPPAHTTDKLKSVIGPTTRAGGLTDNSDWLASWHCVAEVTEGRVSEI